jgi:cationic amino acid transporter 14
VAYEGISVALTLMMPYYELPQSSALATAFDHRGFPAAKYIVAIGAICGLSSSALDGLFPIPRILYAMASDRLIFSFFATVNERTETPIIACVVSGLLTAFLAMFLNLASLAEMLSIGTLLSYTIVSISVVLLRYKPGTVIEDNDGESAEINDGIAPPVLSGNAEIAEEFEDHFDTSDDVTDGQKAATTAATKTTNEMYSKDETSDPFSSKNSNSPPVLTRILKCISGRHLDEPSDDSYLVVKIALAIFILVTIGLESCLVWGMDRLTSKDPLIIVCFVLFLMWMLLAVEVIARQPQSKNKLMFKVPFLPFLPLTAIFVNIFLLLELQTLTWIRFGVWMVIGQ